MKYRCCSEGQLAQAVVEGTTFKMWFPTLLDAAKWCGIAVVAGSFGWTLHVRGLDVSRVRTRSGWREEPANLGMNYTSPTRLSW